MWTSLFAHGFKCVAVGLDACDPAGRARAPGISQRLVSDVWITQACVVSDEAHLFDVVCRRENGRNIVL